MMRCVVASLSLPVRKPYGARAIVDRNRPSMAGGDEPGPQSRAGWMPRERGRGVQGARPAPSAPHGRDAHAGSWDGPGNRTKDPWPCEDRADRQIPPPVPRHVPATPWQRSSMAARQNFKHLIVTPTHLLHSAHLHHCVLNQIADVCFGLKLINIQSRGMGSAVPLIQLIHKHFSHLFRDHSTGITRLNNLRFFPLLKIVFNTHRLLLITGKASQPSCPG